MADYDRNFDAKPALAFVYVHCALRRVLWKSWRDERRPKSKPNRRSRHMASRLRVVLMRAATSTPLTVNATSRASTA